MSRQGRRAGIHALAIVGVFAVASAQGQDVPREVPVPPGGGLASPQSGTMSITSIKQLVRLSGPELDALYHGAPAANVPVGRVRGRAILYPGTRMAVPASKVARLMWQGKVFRDDQPTAVNRFFGLRVIKADVYQGESWLDGGPALILDYSKTSLLYRPYRDEIREVAPGIFLGLMYSRTEPQPTFKMYFALEAAR